MIHTENSIIRLIHIDFHVFVSSITDLNLLLQILQTAKNSLTEMEKRERRAMERKLSEMEEELKVSTAC
jgi:hypothetical protein